LRNEQGWYDYDLKQGNGRKPLPSKEVANVLSTRRDLTPSRLSSEEIIMRVLFPLVNEGFKILEEGIAQRPGDIDVIYLFGYGWPRYTGKLINHFLTLW
jgi:3-hydroxyacyl-CoA dehydrogenase